MKHAFESYGLYRINKISSYCIRTKVIMKETVNLAVLKKAVNIATKRFPYFMVRAIIAEDGGYDFIKNENEIAVFPTSRKNPDFCTEQVGYHLLYVDCEANIIYFNISHALTGGKGLTPWIMSCLYEYIQNKYGVALNVPMVRKSGSEFLMGEDAKPRMEMTDGCQRCSLERFIGAKRLIMDYISSILNPFISSQEYYQIEFNQKDILQLAKQSDNSVVSLFQIMMFKTMAKVFPKEEIFVGETAHDASKDLGIPNTYVNVLSHVLLLFNRKMLDYDLEKLGTMTRGSIILQSDPIYSRNEIKRTLEYYDGIDAVHGQKEKMKYAKENSLSLGKDAVHGTFIVNYAGHADWGELAEYISSYYHIVTGHQMLELTAIGEKIFCCYQQVIRTDKYIHAFLKVLDEMKLSYKIEGPYQKNLVNHALKNLNI